MAAVLSGNRNFEGCVHPLTRANYFASPPLVVAYALADMVISSADLCFKKIIISPSFIFIVMSLRKNVMLRYNICFSFMLKFLIHKIMSV